MVVFRDKKLNAGGIKSKHPGKGRVNDLADGFGEIDHTSEHQFNIRKKVLFKAGKKWCIRNFLEATEIP